MNVSWLQSLKVWSLRESRYGSRRADIEAWSAGIARLSRSWAQPLLSALASGAVVRVMIRDERGNRFTATRRGRFRLWRRDGLAARIAAQSGRVR